MPLEESYPIDNDAGTQAMEQRLYELVMEQNLKDSPPEVYLLEEADGRVLEPTPRVFGERWGLLGLQSGASGQITHRGWLTIRSAEAPELRNTGSGPTTASGRRAKA